MKKTFPILISIFMIAAMFAPIGVSAAARKTVTIAFTGSIHSHLDSVNRKRGLARIAAAIDDIKNGEQPGKKTVDTGSSEGKYTGSEESGSSYDSSSEYGSSDYDSATDSGSTGSSTEKDVFLLDAGGFSMGTPFQSIFASNAPELRMFGDMGYDATALSESEFSYGQKALAKMLNKAASYKETKKEESTEYNKTTYTTETVTTFTDTMPEVLCSNINWRGTLKKKATAGEAEKLKAAWTNYGVTDYTIVSKGGVKMAVFGLMGDKGIQNTAAQGLAWKDRIDRAKDVVKEIKDNEKVDMIVCLSSGGISDQEKGTGEDADLADKVPDIDLIISTNNGKAIDKPIVKGSTTIVAAGGDTAQLGYLKMKKSSGSFKVGKYELYDMDSNVAQDSDTAARVSDFRSLVNSDYMNKYGYSYGTALAKIHKDLRSTDDLVSDSMKNAVKDADVAVISSKSIGSQINKGVLTAAEAYDTCGMGVGANGTSGYPLVTMYLTGKELKKLPEISTNYAAENELADLHFSGLKYEYNAHRMHLNKAFNIVLDRGNGKTEKIENGKLYKVVTGLMEARSLDRLGDVAMGMLSVEPKDENGKVVKDIDSLVQKKRGRELKEWQALANYAEKKGGRAITAAYVKSDGRAKDETRFNPMTIFQDPNGMTFVILAAILIVIVVVIGVIIFLRRRSYTKRGFGRRVFKQKRRNGGRPVFRSSRRKFGRRRW
ncbi:MAG: 5'-nucleotidase C-terminal domain-containing protein [Anaerovoracaceae bacterium]|jgi:5'-nucleotidase/UDP-sugar diphosphatase